jgi:hypothetical protein
LFSLLGFLRFVWRLPKPLPCKTLRAQGQR